ncbi:hypothetical protein ACYOEI_09230 [Singulisphaera rosea]
MTISWRSAAFASLVVLGAVTSPMGGIAQAQSRSSSYVPNTYADFPYNQGSLFYRPQGANAYTRPRSAPRRMAAPRVVTPAPGYYYPQAPQYYYYYPQTYRVR